jgi:hypothetical protein
MDITGHVTAIRGALEDIAGDDEAGQVMAHRMAAAVTPALQLQLLDFLGEVALEVSQQLPDGRLDLQLAGRDAVLVYRPEPTVEAPAALDGSETARLTVRMPDSLKSAIEAAADSEGISTNAWVVGAARRRLSPSSGATNNPVSTGRRITGYVQA